MENITPDLFKENPAKKSHIYTVSEVTQDIKSILENTFNDIWIEGEVSGYTKTSKGFIFFSLKDSASLLKCVIFNSSAAGIKFEIKDGLSLLCLGRISVYEKDGRYQLYVQKLEPKGIGSLQLALEQLKEKLQKEGLFSPEHKRAIPYLPGKIGIVTSLTGAAIKDILKVLDRRFSDVQVVVRPAQVQGEGAKEDIAQAIQEINIFSERAPFNERVEVMIVGRGGGSIEDLWAFNEEIVARAIYNSKIPVISAVGHERDVTISDLVADLRAPTPSVAAELVLPKKEDLKEELATLRENLKDSLAQIVQVLVQTTQGLSHRLSLSAQNLIKLGEAKFLSAQKKLALLNPVVLIEQYKDKARDISRQIHFRMQHFLKLKEAGFKTLVEKLSGMSPLNILSRGYSITFKLPQGSIIKDAHTLKEGEKIKTRMHKGSVISLVTEVEENG